MTKFVTVAAAAVLATTGSAAMAEDWAGPYVGVHAGVARATPHWHGQNTYEDFCDGGEFCESALDGGEGYSTEAINERYHHTVAAVGAQAGYNLQLSSLVLGVEGDFSLNNVKGEVIYPGGGDGYDLRTRMQTLGTIRGRVGYAFDRLLVFGTGGLAFADLRHRVSTDTDLSGSFRNSHGVAYGGGLEMKLGGHVSLVGQVLRVDLGSKGVNVSDTFGNNITAHVKTAEMIGTLGLNLHF